MYVRSLLYQDSAAATRLPQPSPSSRPSTATSYLTTTSPRLLHTTAPPTTTTTHVYKTSSSPIQQGGGGGGNKHSQHSLLIPKTGILRSKSATNLLTRNHTYRENTPKKEGGHNYDRDIKVTHMPIDHSYIWHTEYIAYIQSIYISTYTQYILMHLYYICLSYAIYRTLPLN